MGRKGWLGKGWLGMVAGALTFVLLIPATASADTGEFDDYCSTFGGVFSICSSLNASGSDGWWDNDWDDWGEGDDWGDGDEWSGWGGWNDWDDFWHDWDDLWDDDWEFDFDEWKDRFHDRDHSGGGHGDHGDDDFKCGSHYGDGHKSCEVVPEPITTVLLGTGLFGVGGAAIRRRRHESDDIGTGE